MFLVLISRSFGSPLQKYYMWQHKDFTETRSLVLNAQSPYQENACHRTHKQKYKMWRHSIFHAVYLYIGVPLRNNVQQGTVNNGHWNFYQSLPYIIFLQLCWFLLTPGGGNGFRLHCFYLPLNLHHKYNSNTNIYISVKFLSDDKE